MKFSYIVFAYSVFHRSNNNRPNLTSQPHGMYGRATDNQYVDRPGRQDGRVHGTASPSGLRVLKGIRILTHREMVGHALVCLLSSWIQKL